MQPNETKKLMRAFRSLVIRYRAKGKSDATAVATFVYEKGLPRKLVEEWLQVLVDADRLPSSVKTEQPA